MSKDKKDTISSIGTKVSVREVTETDIDILLSEKLNIHIPEPLYSTVRTWIGCDSSKAQQVVQYANICGIQGVEQLLRG